ncbi:hypothetical protein TUM3811_05100 [Shewanella algae]|nr:hypothetical protein TUM3811_05100 [Shewanella algae]
MFSRGCVKHQKDLAVLSFFTSGSINSANPDGTCLSGIDLIYKAIAAPKGGAKISGRAPAGWKP